IGAESRRSQVLFDRFGSHFHLFAGTLGDPPGLLAADGADLTLEVADAGLASVAADQEAKRLIGELNIPFRVESVFARLTRNQVPESDHRFFLLGIAFERDDLHAIPQ